MQLLLLHVPIDLSRFDKFFKMSVFSQRPNGYKAGVCCFWLAASPSSWGLLPLAGPSFPCAIPTTDISILKHTRSQWSANTSKSRDTMDCGIGAWTLLVQCIASRSTVASPVNCSVFFVFFLSLFVFPFFFFFFFPISFPPSSLPSDLFLSCLPICAFRSSVDRWRSARRVIFSWLWQVLTR